MVSFANKNTATLHMQPHHHTNTFSLCPFSCAFSSRGESRLKEIVVAAAGGGRDGALVLGHGGEDGEARVEVLVQVHDGGDVAAAVAVVGRGPDRHDGFVFEMPLRERD